MKFNNVLKITKGHAAYKWRNGDLHRSVSDRVSAFSASTANGRIVLALTFLSSVSSGRLHNAPGALLHFAANSKLLAQ